MSVPNIQNVLNEYRQVGVRGVVVDASPHRLIQMLMEGVLERISAAKGFISRNDTAKKGESISSAISIIDGLAVSLDMEAGGDLAQNLASLYDYMTRRLLEANLKNDVSLLDEVTSLMVEIKSAWDAIANEASKV